MSRLWVCDGPECPEEIQTNRDLDVGHEGIRLNTLRVGKESIWHERWDFCSTKCATMFLKDRLLAEANQEPQEAGKLEE